MQSFKDVEEATKRSRMMDRHVADSNESWLNYQGGTCRTAVPMMVHVPNRTSDLNFWNPPTRLPILNPYRVSPLSLRPFQNHEYVKKTKKTSKVLPKIELFRSVMLDCCLSNISLRRKKERKFYLSKLADSMNISRLY